MNSVGKTASLSTSAKCGNLMSWLKRNEKYLEPGKGVPALQGSAEYLRSLVEDIGWRRVLLVEFRKGYMDKIVKFLQTEKKKHQIFNAFNLTPLQHIRVVLIGQDPYHDENQAHGLCFSVCKGVKLPPSLINIYKELKTDIPNFKIPDHGCLESWARQGVFMLNATLTVEAHRPNSHNHIGWQKFTDEVIRIISRDCKGIVFLLWGGFAHKKEYIIDKKKHIVIKTAHPSPLSARMFFGCKCFSRTNEALMKLGRPAIDWSAF
ncbi:Uracil-DNA glycosylase [Dirofilaria immitis]|nr:Uracil-DNA glycosylase [Dirofilaria immitis]